MYQGKQTKFMHMDSNPEFKNIEIGQDTLKHLNTLRKWTMFLAVSGFIFFGLIIILGLIAGTFLTAFNQSNKAQGIPDAVVIAAFAAFALINFFPIFFLFRFSKHTSHAVAAHDKKEMHIAIKNLKRFFIYIGVLLIVVITVYLATLVVAGRSAAILHGFN
jgi:hypothetical protein